MIFSLSHLEGTTVVASGRSDGEVALWDYGRGGDREEDTVRAEPDFIVKKGDGQGAVYAVEGWKEREEGKDKDTYYVAVGGDRGGNGGFSFIGEVMEVWQVKMPSR